MIGPIRDVQASGFNIPTKHSAYMLVYLLVRYVFLDTQHPLCLAPMSKMPYRPPPRQRKRHRV